MKKKIIKAKKLTLDIDNLYKNDFYLLKTIAQTKKIRNNNKSLEKRKNNLKQLMIEINNEYELNNNPTNKKLKENNEIFHKEYELFKKRMNKKETKSVFKDLVNLYKRKGYRIPNFSINSHNLFKINPLLEANTEMISNGLLDNQIKKKNNDSEKIIRYLKKLGIILSSRMSTDSNLQKNLMKKFKMPKLKVIINEEDTVENLKKKIEILNNLINTNALSKLDEHKKRRFKNISRHNSFVSMRYNSNKKLRLTNKGKNVLSRRPSNNNNNRLLNLGKNKEFNLDLERKDSNISSVSNASFMSINNYFNTKLNNEKTSKNLNKISNFSNYANINLRATFSKNLKTIDIPVINFQRINQRRNTNISNLSIYDNKPSLKIMNNFFSSKQNNILNINENKRSKTIKNNIFNAKSQANNNIYLKREKNNFTLFFKPQSSHESNNSFSEELLYDSKSPRNWSKNNNSINGNKKNESYSYPYTSKNEFINFAYNKFKKRNDQNEEKYIKQYLNKVKGYDNEKIETFVNNIYDKNLKNNIKDLKKHIADYDIYSKTERLYLNSHLINRIKPLLNSMEERDKMIYRLEKNLTNAVSNK